MSLFKIFQNKEKEVLNQIVPDIQRTSDLVQEITASSVEQSTGYKQVNNAIQNLCCSTGKCFLCLRNGFLSFIFKSKSK